MQGDSDKKICIVNERIVSIWEALDERLEQNQLPPIVIDLYIGRAIVCLKADGVAVCQY